MGHSAINQYKPLSRFRTRLECLRNAPVRLRMPSRHRRNRVDKPEGGRSLSLLKDNRAPFACVHRKFYAFFGCILNFIGKSDPEVDSRIEIPSVRCKFRAGENMSGNKCVKPPRKPYTKEPHEMSHSEKLRLIDDELNSFYK